MQPNSSISTFLETYNQGNRIPDNAAENFRIRTEADNKVLVQHLSELAGDASPENRLICEKIKQIDVVLNDSRTRGYDKLNGVANVLLSISNDLVQSADDLVKKSGRNIVKSYLEAARETQDQQLLNAAYQIGKAALAE